MNSLKEYLFAAANRKKNDISSDNPYRNIGFDGDSRRLGWVLAQPLQSLRCCLEGLENILKGKKKFIFVGMGGSINGIKPLISLYSAKLFYTIDSLDPRAISCLLESIDDFEETLVIPISKSGTTTETQLLAGALREAFAAKLGEAAWQNNFLWLSDPTAFEKLNSLGWQAVAKAAIQIDQADDIGGRFSSPHTLIFLLPLYLLLEKDIKVLEDLYRSFADSMEPISREALALAEKYAARPDAYFAPRTDPRLGDSFSSWIVQLFQESLGSKTSDLQVKTLPNSRDCAIFEEVALSEDIAQPVLTLMRQMYFFQTFVAFYAGKKKLNFVNQEYVEKYKHQMRELSGRRHAPEDVAAITVDELIETLKSGCPETARFIEIVLYFYPDQETIGEIERRFRQALPDKTILIFIGSDWNHQSYQAAFASRDTFFVLLSLPDYLRQVPLISQQAVAKSIETLVLIAKATQLTIEKKSILFALRP